MDATWFAGPIYLIALFLEVRLLRRLRREGRGDLRGYERRDAWTSVLCGATAIIAWIPLNLAIFGLASWLWPYRLFDLGTGALAWAVILLGWDFSFYWQHRLEHEVRLFWGGHVTHHSSRYFNFATALRQSWTPWSGPLIYPWWALLGIRPEMILIAGGWNLFYQFWVHTEAVDRLPAWVEAWLNTPSHHRVHHGANPQYLDKNYAGVLIVWDRLFGTFEPERERVMYGLTKNIASHNLVSVQLHEYLAIARDVLRARRLRERLWLTFASPAAISARRP
ncbi:MAG TPA: sterol desaturase family protein [Candidatus Dormibacteraeota bacterium]|nr:sterol desaturase family protein [Candidatus Dormibacteraeota bacterium]